jgi:hypothetical protein
VCKDSLIINSNIKKLEVDNKKIEKKYYVKSKLNLTFIVKFYCYLFVVFTDFRGCTKCCLAMLFQIQNLDQICNNKL